LILQTLLQGLQSFRGLTRLVQRVLQLLLFRIVGRRGRLADLFLNIV
jgi:hypothetical protein